MACLSAYDRARQGLTLHRSGVHAQGEVDVIAARHQQLIRRGRREGRASSLFITEMTGGSSSNSFYPFKPLGAPKDTREISEMATSKMYKAGAQSSGGQHHQSQVRRLDVERNADWPGTDAKFGADMDDGDDGALDGQDQAQQQHIRQPNSLFGKDLPPCQGRYKSSDGFGMLREFVRESEQRVQQVKTLVPGTAYGLDYEVSMLDYLMPPRADYPAVAPRRQGAGRAARTSSEGLPEIEQGGGAPASARAVLQTVHEKSPEPPPGPSPRSHPEPPHRTISSARESARKARSCPGRPVVPQAYTRKVYVSPVQSEMRPRPLPIRLPSLEDFIASSGPSMGGRKEGGEVGLLRDKINELLGLPRHTTLKLPTEELGGVRRGRNDFKRKIEKQLNDAFKDRGLFRRLMQDGRVDGDEARRGEPEREKSPGPGAEEAAGGGHDGKGKKKREWTEAEEAEAYAKVVALLREPDPTISPVARLRSTLVQYQSSRDTHCTQLQSALYSMDADRLNSLKRRAKHLRPKSEGPTADAKTSCALMRLEAERDMLEQHLQEKMKRQYLWYRDLWYHVQNDKRELPRVAHFCFDFVKQVLEYGEVFTDEMFHAMLSQIESFEFAEANNGTILAKLVVKMAKDISGVGTDGISEWFLTHRREIPREIEKLIGSPYSETSVVKNDLDEPVGESSTFMTEGPRTVTGAQRSR